MKNYLVSIEPHLFSAVVDQIIVRQISILRKMDMIAILSISCTESQRDLVTQMPGVLAVEEEGTSFAI